VDVRIYIYVCVCVSIQIPSNNEEIVHDSLPCAFN
jgi:hypothetical protein